MREHEHNDITTVIPRRISTQGGASERVRRTRKTLHGAAIRHNRKCDGKVSKISISRVCVGEGDGGDVRVCVRAVNVLTSILTGEVCHRLCILLFSIILIYEVFLFNVFVCIAKREVVTTLFRPESLTPFPSASHPPSPLNGKKIGEGDGRGLIEHLSR